MITSKGRFNSQYFLYLHILALTAAATLLAEVNLLQIKLPTKEKCNYTITSVPLKHISDSITDTKP